MQGMYYAENRSSNDRCQPEISNHNEPAAASTINEEMCGADFSNTYQIARENSAEKAYIPLDLIEGSNHSVFNNFMNSPKECVPYEHVIPPPDTTVDPIPFDQPPSESIFLTVDKQQPGDSSNQINNPNMPILPTLTLNLGCKNSNFGDQILINEDDERCSSIKEKTIVENDFQKVDSTVWEENSFQLLHFQSNYENSLKTTVGLIGKT